MAALCWACSVPEAAISTSGERFSTCLATCSGPRPSLWARWRSGDSDGLRSIRLLSILISLLIVWTAWDITRESLNILLEGLPRGLELKQVTQAICGVDGVLDVHDLHIWSLGSNSHALSCHVLIEDMPPSRSDHILHKVNHVLGRPLPRPPHDGAVRAYELRDLRYRLRDSCGRPCPRPCASSLINPYPRNAAAIRGDNVLPMPEKALTEFWRDLQPISKVFQPDALPGTIHPECADRRPQALRAFQRNDLFAPALDFAFPESLVRHPDGEERGSGESPLSSA